MTSPLVHFVGLLSGTAPFNKTATPIDTLPETDQVTGQQHRRRLTLMVSTGKSVVSSVMCGAWAADAGDVGMA
jgi:hypothetical protein